MKDAAVVLSGYPAGLGVVRALALKGIQITLGHYDPQEVGRFSRYIRRVESLPNAETEENRYIECLLSDAIGKQGEPLIPTADQTLWAVSRNKKLLQEKYLVACPDWEITTQFLDKRNTCTLAEKAGVPAPKTFLPRTVEDIQQWGSIIQYPCLAKPSLVHLYSRHFPRKMRMVENQDELYRAFIEAREANLDLMIQEYIPGDDFLGANYNAYYWEGKPLVEFTAHKIRNAPPWMGSPSVLISERIPEVVAFGRRILGQVKYSGYACTEFKRDPRDGIYKLMEVNARHNLSSMLAIRCGVNFPWIEYQHLVEGVLPETPDIENGVYWVDISRDIGYRMVNFGKERISLKDFVTPYLSKHVFAVFDWRDPAPALLKAVETLRGVIHGAA